MQEKKLESRDFTDEQLVTASTETMGGHPSQKSLWAQSELTRRLMESIKTLDKTTSSYSRRLVVLTGILILAAMFQLVIMAIELPFSETERVLIAALLVFALIWALWYLAPDRK